jgi:hypothetical protein
VRFSWNVGEEIKLSCMADRLQDVGNLIELVKY